jgi:hypothetical protein
MLSAVRTVGTNSQHMSKASHYSKVAARKAAGLCIDCAKDSFDPATHRHMVRCRACRIKWSNRRRQIIAEGRCADCRKAPRLIGLKTCQQCRLRNRERNRRTLARRRAETLAARQNLLQAKESHGVAMLAKRRQRRVKITC